jgi:hypothetical protein
MRPDFTNFEKAACFCQNLVSYDAKTDGNLQAIYYIGVYAMTDMEYTLNVIIERNQYNPIKLENGLKQKKIIMWDEIAYFSFYKDNDLGNH